MRALICRHTSLALACSSCFALACGQPSSPVPSRAAGPAAVGPALEEPGAVAHAHAQTAATSTTPSMVAGLTTGPNVAATRPAASAQWRPVQTSNGLYVMVGSREVQATTADHPRRQGSNYRGMSVRLVRRWGMCDGHLGAPEQRADYRVGHRVFETRLLPVDDCPHDGALFAVLDPRGPPLQRVRSMDPTVQAAMRAAERAADRFADGLFNTTRVVRDGGATWALAVQCHGAQCERDWSPDPVSFALAVARPGADAEVKLRRLTHLVVGMMDGDGNGVPEVVEFLEDPLNPDAFSGYVVVEPSSRSRGRVVVRFARSDSMKLSERVRPLIAAADAG